ncbi:MAG: MerR family transcriptional regulator [Reyranella sp.]|nr:MerR family transcriptional regulator [Reyranella sp.]MDP3160464.1 MerR family transcriptional regulator [Reyranella sp.]
MTDDQKLKEKQWYSLNEAHKATDLSEAMIKYLVREELIHPSMTKQRVRGAKYRFIFADLLILRAIARLLEEGIEVRRLQNDLKKMRAKISGLTFESARLKYLATDGFRAYLMTGNDIMEEVRTGQFAFRFMLNVGTLRHEVVAFRRTRVEAKRHRANGLPHGALIYKTANEP